MAAPTFVAAGTLVFPITGTTITASWPAAYTPVADDVAVVGYMHNTGSTFTTPTNWTILGTAVNASGQSTAWFWKRLAGGEAAPATTASLAFTNTLSGYGRTYVFRGCVTTGDPFESVGNAGVPTSSTTPQTSAITTTGLERLAVSLVLVDDDNTWASAMPPTGWVNMGGRLAQATGGDCMSDGISRTVPTATTIAATTFAVQSAADFWRTISFALIPQAGAQVQGFATGEFGFAALIAGIRIPQPQAGDTRAPIPAVLMVNTPGDWAVHPYYKATATISNWGNATDMAAIDAAVAAYPARTRVVLIAEDNGTANGRCVAAMNWALRHYAEVQSIHLRAPIIDLEERHDRLGGATATSIENAYGGSGTQLVLPGSWSGGNAQTPDAAALDITGDFDLRMELCPDNWIDASKYWHILAGKWVETGNQRSWYLRIRGFATDSGATAGRLELLWSANGSTTLEATSTVTAGSVFGSEPGAIRVTLDVVNGANKTVTFYTSPTIGGTWTQLGDPVTTAGNTSIFSSSAPLEIGTINNRTDLSVPGLMYPIEGAIKKVELRNGIAGTVVANPDFTTQTIGATSFADSTGKTWTINSTASIGAGFLGAMPSWNPAYLHRQEIAGQLFTDRLHIWRDSADTVTPIAVTDALAATMRATLHTSLGTPADIIPETQDWVDQPAWQEMKRVHDYARTSGNNTHWKAADGGSTVVVPDGRQITFYSDTVIGQIDADETWATFGIIRNSIVIRDGNGNITGQHFSGAPGTAALVPNQTEWPDSFYWPVGASMENGTLKVLCLLREGPGFGTAIENQIVELDPSTLATISVFSLGDPLPEPQQLVEDTDTGFTYITYIDPARIARVPIGQLANPAAWRYWDGTGWGTDKAAMVPLQRHYEDGFRRLDQHHFNHNGWDIRRYDTGWLALVHGEWFDYMAIYSATEPQGPYTQYRHIPMTQAGGTRYGTQLYAYLPFWHPELDPAPDRLMISWNEFTFTSVPQEDRDFYNNDTHFIICPIYRDLFT